MPSSLRSSFSALTPSASRFTPRTSAAQRASVALRATTRRATLRDLYTSGLVSIFRRDSVLRVWEPLRETPRPVEPSTPHRRR